MRTGSILLLGLLALFGILYFSNITYRDLWANLFAALVAVLLIDGIVERSKMQKKERTIRYAKGYVANICVQLMWHLKPPENWEKRISQTNSDWKDYFQIIAISRTEAMNKLDTFLGGYSHVVVRN